MNARLLAPHMEDAAPRRLIGLDADTRIRPMWREGRRWWHRTAEFAVLATCLLALWGWWVAT